MILSRGRRAQPGRAWGAGARIGVGILGVISAVSMAVALVATGPGAADKGSAVRSPRLSAPTAVQLTSAQRQQLARYMALPAHRTEVSSLMEHSFEQAGLQAGTSGVQVPGRISLDVAYGITGEHVWAIVSFADVYDGAVAAFTAGCVALFVRYDLSKLSWLCGWAATELSNWSAGRAWSAKHGAWIAVYWWPLTHYTGGYW